MINLISTTEYFEIEIERSNGIIRNIFLSNGSNQIITTGNKGKEESAVLSSLLNDSLYIITFNLYGEENTKASEKPLEISVTLSEEQAYLFSIKNQFLLGVLVDRKMRDVGHKMSHDIMKYVQSQLENVAEWVQNNDTF